MVDKLCKLQSLLSLVSYAKPSNNDLFICEAIYREDFADYAEFCFKTFGDRVKNWMTFNEPRVVAALGYDNGIFAPARCSKAFGNCIEGNSATEPYIVAHHLILAHASAVQRYRQHYQVNSNSYRVFKYIYMMVIDGTDKFSGETKGKDWYSS